MSSPTRRWTGCRHGERGFTYLVVLLTIAILGLGLVASVEVWETLARRQKAEQLEWVGTQFVQAIGSYYEASPGGAKVYPRALQDLVEDRRFLAMRRHLRQVYPNPFTDLDDWETIGAPDGRVRGVRVVVPTQRGNEPRDFVYMPGSQ